MSTVTVINPIAVSEGKEKEVLASFGHFAAYFSQKSGYISSTLYQSISSDAKYALINISIWASAEHFQAALSHNDFGKVAQAAEGFTSYPGVYQTVEAL